MTPFGDTALDPDRILALSYVPSARRAAVGALWRLDAALGAVLAAGKEPMISRIKLAWWREALERLDREPAPPEPVLKSLADHVLPAGISGAGLVVLAQGWSELLSDEPLTLTDLGTYARSRGSCLFDYSAKLLGGGDRFNLADPGAAWALVDLARHVGNEQERDLALDAARSGGPFEARWPSRLRPLGMLFKLAQRDLASSPGNWEVQGSPGRMVRMLGHRFTGR